MENAKHPRRRRRKPAEQRELVAKWKSSGLSAERFARDHDVTVATLLRWDSGARRAQAEQDHPPSFVPVVVDSRPAPRRTVHKPIAYLRFAGVRVAIFADAPVQALERLFTAAKGIASC